MSSSSNDIVSQVSELITLITTYIKENTLIPLSRLIRFIAMGLAGSLFMAIGLILVSVGFLRFLQTLSPFDENFSFAPYLLVMVADVVVIALLGAMVSKPGLIAPRKERK